MNPVAQVLALGLEQYLIGSQPTVQAAVDAAVARRAGDDLARPALDRYANGAVDSALTAIEHARLCAVQQTPEGHRLLAIEILGRAIEIAQQ